LITETPCSKPSLLREEETGRRCSQKVRYLIKDRRTGWDCQDDEKEVK
jgi:hypothetical protein